MVVAVEIARVAVGLARVAVGLAMIEKECSAAAVENIAVVAVPVVESIVVVAAEIVIETAFVAAAALAARIAYKVAPFGDAAAAESLDDSQRAVGVDVVAFADGMVVVVMMVVVALVAVAVDAAMTA